MATTRLMPLHVGKGRTAGTAIAAIIDYVENPEKTDNGKLITSWQCDSRVADSEFLFSKQQYIRNTGRVRGADDVIAYHLRQSFRPGEITPEEANRLGCELAQRFTKGNHAYIVCTHIDKAHVHNHIIWNSTALDEQRKFRNFWGSTRAVRRLNDTICVENGYSIVADPKGKGQTYDKWLGNQKKPSHRERICYAIDEALAQKPQSFDELLELLRQSGYQIKGGKVPSLLGENQKRFIRMDTLGENYTPDALRAIVSGARRHTPKKKRSMDISAKPSGSLLIDIQAKLQEGKCAGYARWAKNFNLKQLSQTLIYLEENGLLDRGILEERTATATSRYRTLSTDIKAKEQRIAEIKIMQQHMHCYITERQPDSHGKRLCQQCPRWKADACYSRWFANHSQLDIVDTGVFDCHSEAYVGDAQECADALHCCLGYVSGSNSLLERLIGGQWEDGFLVANPGQIIGHKDFFC